MFCESHSVLSDSLRPHELYRPQKFPGQNTGVCSLSLLLGIFPTQGSNQGLPHCRKILYQLSHKGSPNVLWFSAVPARNCRHRQGDSCRHRQGDSKVCTERPYNNKQSWKGRKEESSPLSPVPAPCVFCRLWFCKVRCPFWIHNCISSGWNSPTSSLVWVSTAVGRRQACAGQIYLVFQNEKAGQLGQYLWGWCSVEVLINEWMDKWMNE